MGVPSTGWQGREFRFFHLSFADGSGVTVFSRIVWLEWVSYCLKVFCLARMTLSSPLAVRSSLFGGVFVCGLPRWPSGKKNPPASAGDPRDVGSIPGSGRSPGAGNGNSLQYCGISKLLGSSPPSLEHTRQKDNPGQSSCHSLAPQAPGQSFVLSTFHLSVSVM